MIRPSAQHVMVVADEGDLALLVLAHLAVAGIAVDGPVAGEEAVAAARARGSDALVVLTAGDAPSASATAGLVARARAAGVPSVVIVDDDGASQAELVERVRPALLPPAPGAPSELLIGVPRGRDLWEALEAAITSTADDVARRPGWAWPGTVR